MVSRKEFALLRGRWRGSRTSAAPRVKVHPPVEVLELTVLILVIAARLRERGQFPAAAAALRRCLTVESACDRTRLWFNLLADPAFPAVLPVHRAAQWFPDNAPGYGFTIGGNSSSSRPNRR